MNCRRQNCIQALGEPPEMAELRDQVAELRAWREQAQRELEELRRELRNRLEGDGK